ncbi:MAG: hypothetical protein AAF741_14160 [Bacteroidota bacterium]
MQIILQKGASHKPYNLGHIVNGDIIEVKEDVAKKLIEEGIAIDAKDATGESDASTKGKGKATTAETTTSKKTAKAEKAAKTTK